MATNMSLQLVSAILSHFLLMTLMISSALSTDIPYQNQDLVIATQEMQKANYFAFVMLINMSPLDLRLQGNITFLMPHDRMLARIKIPQAVLPDFLLRHSIPSPLLFSNLENIPTGTIFPSSFPKYMIEIANNGRRNYFLNNVKIISPNICVMGHSIRCHGIDGVLTEATVSVTNSSTSSNTALTPPCPNNTSRTLPVTSASPPAPSTDPSSPSPIISPPLSDNVNPPLALAPSPSETNNRQHKSGSTDKLLSSYGGLLESSLTCLLVYSIVLGL
ncbi:FAS1 domain-containing protein [Quillaja saponaria]|uniref:FAS1 domain-containing protein n=1 Tax=Quillaja saponaria TaxID=32244 RepID=A0AAD7VPK5_QUISA|nr:FAS1 domain-containing protein [Quillaja saponaria]